MKLTDEEKREMLELAASSSMRDAFNVFLNHPEKEYRPFIERIMKL